MLALIVLITYTLLVNDAKAEPRPMISSLSGKCLTVNGYNTDNNGLVDMYDCLNQSNQLWNYNLTTFVSVSSKKCLTVHEATRVEGEIVNQYDCVTKSHPNGNENQIWSIAQKVPKGFLFINKLSGKCLAIRGKSKQNGALVEQSTCDASDPAKLWKFANEDNTVTPPGPVCGKEPSYKCSTIAYGLVWTCQKNYTGFTAYTVSITGGWPEVKYKVKALNGKTVFLSKQNEKITGAEKRNYDLPANDPPELTQTFTVSDCYVYGEYHQCKGHNQDTVQVEMSILCTCADGGNSWTCTKNPTYGPNIYQVKSAKNVEQVTFDISYKDSSKEYKNQQNQQVNTNKPQADYPVRANAPGQSEVFVVNHCTVKGVNKPCTQVLQITSSTPGQTDIGPPVAQQCRGPNTNTDCSACKHPYMRQTCKVGYANYVDKESFCREQNCCWDEVQNPQRFIPRCFESRRALKLCNVEIKDRKACHCYEKNPSTNPNDCVYCGCCWLDDKDPMPCFQATGIPPKEPPLPVPAHCSVDTDKKRDCTACKYPFMRTSCNGRPNIHSSERNCLNDPTCCYDPTDYSYKFHLPKCFKATIDIQKQCESIPKKDRVECFCLGKRSYEGIQCAKCSDCCYLNSQDDIPCFKSKIYTVKGFECVNDNCDPKDETKKCCGELICVVPAGKKLGSCKARPPPCYADGETCISNEFIPCCDKTKKCMQTKVGDYGSLKCNTGECLGKYALCDPKGGGKHCCGPYVCEVHHDVARCKVSYFKTRDTCVKPGTQTYCADYKCCSRDCDTFKGSSGQSAQGKCKCSKLGATCVSDDYCCDNNVCSIDQVCVKRGEDPYNKYECKDKCKP